jgi:hypothetical protein
MKVKSATIVVVLKRKCLLETIINLILAETTGRYVQALK